MADNTGGGVVRSALDYLLTQSNRTKTPVLTRLAGQEADTSKWIGDGVITLAQPYTNFTDLLFYFSNDSYEYLGPVLVNTKYLYSAFTTGKKLNKWVILPQPYGQEWAFDTAKSTTTALASLYGHESCAIAVIYGVNYK